jgi:hypothetical protein
MKWLGYDNAPEPAICSIPGCTVQHTNLQHKPLHSA